MDTSSITLNANYVLTPFIVKPVPTLSHVHPVLILSITINKNVLLNVLSILLLKILSQTIAIHVR